MDLFTQINQTETAIKSYHQSGEIVEGINARVLEYIRQHGKVSNNDIQRGLDITARQATCARWHLKQEGRIKIAGSKKDEITGHSVQLVEYTPVLMGVKIERVTIKEKIKQVVELCKEDGSDLAKQILEILK